MAAKLKTCSLIEQRAVIRFLAAEGVKTSFIHSRMKEQYGESCMSQTSCYRWVDEFKNGREDITDKPRSSRPVDVSTPDTVAQVENLINSVRRLAIDDVAKYHGHFTWNCTQHCLREERFWRRRAHLVCIGCETQPPTLTPPRPKPSLRQCN